MNVKRMHRNALWTSAIFIFAGLFASWASAASVNFQDGTYANFFTGGNVYTGTQNTFVWQGNSTMTFSGREDMWVGWAGLANARARSLLRFDLSAFAGSYASITSMTLRLTSSTYSTFLTGTGTVHWIAASNSAWVEGTTNGAEQSGSPSWKYRRFDTNDWAGSEGLNTAGTDYDSTVLGTFTWTNNEPAGTVRDITIAGTTEQLTAMANLMTNASSNAGFLLRPNVDEQNHLIVFATSHHATTSRRPRLSIGYTSAPLPSSTATATYRTGEPNRFTGGSAYAGTEDTWVWGGDGPLDRNYGGRTDLWVGESGNANGFNHTLLRFDLSSCAGRCNPVTAITLHLTMASPCQLAGTGVVYWIGAANKNWVQGTANDVIQSGSSCWRYKQHDTSFWAGSMGLNTANTDYYPKELGTFTWTNYEAAGTPHDIALQGEPAELTWLVAQMTNPDSNTGFLIRGLTDIDPDMQNHLAVLASSRYATVSYRPGLTIHYLPCKGAVLMFR